jgi:hypothetical protein
VKSERKQKGRQPISNITPRSGLFMKKRDKKAFDKESKPEPASLNEISKAPKYVKKEKSSLV